MEPLKVEGDYDTGQLFLHKLFNYRGVILFPWIATVNDADIILGSDEKYKEGFPEPVNPNRNNKTGEMKHKEKRGHRHTYYQVRVQCQYIVMYIQLQLAISVALDSVHHF